MRSTSITPASMFFRGIGTATPSTRYTKAECLEAFERSDWYARLDGRSHWVARTVLQHDNGIEARRLAVDSISDVFRIDPNTLIQRFLAHAPALAAKAAGHALAKSSLAERDIGAVIVSTCTGYLCPGLSGYVVERLGLRADVQAYDLVGQGCAAALPNLQLARALLVSGECEHVLSVCVEVSSAAMYLDNDPGVLISACLFGDGAGAAILSRDPAAGGRIIEWIDSTSLIDPSKRQALMFEQRDGMLRNILTRAVPGLAATYARRVLDSVLDRAGCTSQISARGSCTRAGAMYCLHSNGNLDSKPGTFVTALRCCANTGTCPAHSFTSPSRLPWPTRPPQDGGGSHRSGQDLVAMEPCYR
jgi:predicted naringenin-chalcone synthase